MTTRRLFISTVTHEFKSCRVRLSEDLRFPDVVAENQEEYIAKLPAGSSILVKLDDYIRGCHALIHLIGQQTSADGRAASKDAVDDLLTRYPDLPAVTGLPDAELRTLSYTQWEAWLAYYHIKKTNPNLKLLIATPETGFVPDHPPHAGTAHAQKLSQAWHQLELKNRARYSEITFTDCRDLSIQILRALKDLLPAQQPDQKIADTRLVTRHTTDQLFGRDTELKLLDDAWAARDTVNVQCVIAWGGVGKTALLAHWVQTRFRSRGWKDGEGRPDPLFYFDWTFYDQGTRSSQDQHAGAASIGTFFVEALKHFGDPEPDKPDDKAKRLAARVQAHRALLVLDGLEPLQYPHNHPQAGQITDPGLAQFLRLLAQKNPGLCLISSREVLSDLGGHLAANAPQKELGELSREAAISLLRKLQVTGSDEDLEKAAEDYQHHALSLILLGRFLFTARGGDIRRRDTVTLEKADTKRDAQTRGAWHVLETYERWLDSPEGNATDLQALRLVGLFDRPARPDCLDALRAAPAIPGLTDRLVTLDADDWNAVLRRLNEAHLIQLRFPPRDPGSQAPHPEPRSVPVDAHPLIREYFAKHLREKEAAAFESAHSRIFDHLCETAPECTKFDRMAQMMRQFGLGGGESETLPTLDDLQPLYQAVVHGCLAGRQQETLEKVYDPRILRGTGDNGFYSTDKLGAIGVDLGAVAAFFETPWSRLSPKLSEPDQAWLLNEAATRLRALGRLTEALEPMRVSIDMAAKQEDWKNAAIYSSNLSELEVTLGELGSAVADARRAIAFADRIQPPDLFQRMGKRTTAADALHQRGRMKDEGRRMKGDAEEDDGTEARRLFEEAEALQRERQPQFELLYSVQGFRYCDLILAPAERAAWQTDNSAFRTPHSAIESALAEAERRATNVQKRRTGLPTYILLDIALDHLTLARVALYRAMLSPVHPSAFILHPFSTALTRMRESNNLDDLPKALLTAAAAHHLAGDAPGARALLDEAQQIAERGPMPLHLADVHLHRARLAGSEKDEGRRKNWPGVDPKAELAKARALIKKHHYGRRLAELADAEAAATHW